MSTFENYHMMQSGQAFNMIPAGINYMYHQEKPIAPSPMGANMMSSSAGPIVKKKYNYTNKPYGEQLPSIERRNARERNRVKQVNDGFATLRQHIPSSIVSALSNGGRGASKKLSKVDTLRMALEYIQGLQDLIEDSDSQGSSIGSASPASSYSPEEYVLQNSYSEASVSPTPSYNSDNSISNSSEYIQTSFSSDDHVQYKFQPFENYTQMAANNAPVDDGFFDCMSSWQ